MNEQIDVLADLEPTRRQNERTTRILSLASSIVSARARGCSWKQIAERLTATGISVSADHLRVVISRAEPKNKPNKKRIEKAAAKANSNANHMPVAVYDTSVDMQPATEATSGFLELDTKL
jgi:hypothetical protein